jgi:Na+/H+ antiporter NhaD/arsenite permease-like protein
MLPFVLYLLLIAALPMFLGHFWEHNRNKLFLAVVASVPVVIHLAGRHEGWAALAESAQDYVSFMALLSALFCISGGIYLRGTLACTPTVNTIFLAVGALLASFVGTTGASALLIRPLLRTNRERPHATHVVIFFIFTVSNAGGMLTPLGDPPLFLGFLRGVPFAWTLRLFPAWALVNGALLVIFFLFDRRAFARDGRQPAPAPKSPQSEVPVERLSIEGGLNLLWLLGVLLAVLAAGTLGPMLLPNHHLRALAQIVTMVVLAALSLLTTPKAIHTANQFSWAPMIEVAAVFVGIFVTMVPALAYLGERGPSLGVIHPWQFFWASGALSSVLDNAPTYLTFASLASGVADGGTGILSASNLGALAVHPHGAELLAAVSCGSVFMGANTYIGNGPNFMVKAIAEQHQVTMPGFFAYTVWSGLILLPLFAVVGLLLF